MAHWYLAGPMRGRPQFNIPAFVAATEHLRAAGHQVTSPAELDSDAIRSEALASPTGEIVGGSIGGETPGMILARDVQIIADGIDGIIFLPAWDRSKGARLEAFVGLLFGKRFAYYDHSSKEGVYEIPAAQVRAVLKQNMP
jgi:hypothetical protein